MHAKLSPVPSFLANAALLSGVFALSGCSLVSDWVEKKANKALQEELKKDSEKTAKGDGPDGKAGAGKSDDASGAETWTETVTGSKVTLARIDLAEGGLKGFSMLAPEGAKVATSPGGRGADISELGYGFAVWVTEDPTATLDLMKQGAEALHKDAKLENVDDNSFIVAAKSFDGEPAYYYKGLFSANGKKYRCETQSSTAPTAKSHAEQVDKVCESLQVEGKSIASKQDAKPSEDDGAAPAPAAEQAAAPATKPASAEQPAKQASNDKAPADKEPAAPPAKDSKPASPPATPPASPPATEKAEGTKGPSKKLGAKKSRS